MPSESPEAGTEEPMREIYEIADALLQQEETFEHSMHEPQVTHDEWVEAMKRIRALASGEEEN